MIKSALAFESTGMTNALRQSHYKKRSLLVELFHMTGSNQDQRVL
jgi:hypothetical protein